MFRIDFFSTLLGRGWANPYARRRNVDSMEKHSLSLLLQILFLLWLGVVNVLYYAQFRGMMGARLRPLLRLWH